MGKCIAAARTDTKFEKIYYCKKCGTVFVYNSDLEDHERIWGHRDFESVDFEILVKK